MARYQAGSGGISGSVVNGEFKSFPKTFENPDPPKWSPGPAYRFFNATAKTRYTECRSVYVGTAGNITLSGSNDTIATFTSVPAGTVLPTRATEWSGSASNVTFLY